MGRDGHKIFLHIYCTFIYTTLTNKSTSTSCNTIRDKRTGKQAKLVVQQIQDEEHVQEIKQKGIEQNPPFCFVLM